MAGEFAFFSLLFFPLELVAFEAKPGEIAEGAHEFEIELGVLLETFAQARDVEPVEDGVEIDHGHVGGGFGKDIVVTFGGEFLRVFFEETNAIEAVVIVSGILNRR